MKTRRFYHMMLLASALLLSGAAYAAETTIRFTPVPTGLSSRLVYDKWMHAPEYKELVESMDMPPDYMLARGDINDDGVDEIFARHSDSDLSDYCPNFGEECLLIIYKVVKGDLVEIGRMYSSLNIVVLPKHYMGYHDLRIQRAHQKMTEYRWNGQQYEAK